LVEIDINGKHPLTPRLTLECRKYRRECSRRTNGPRYRPRPWRNAAFIPRAVSPSRAHAHRVAAANRNQSNGISEKLRHGTGRHDVVRSRRGESRRARSPGDLSIRGSQRVVDHPLALQQTAAAAAEEEEEERKRKRRRRWRRRRRRW